MPPDEPRSRPCPRPRSGALCAAARRIGCVALGLALVGATARAQRPDSVRADSSRAGPRAERERQGAAPAPAVATARRESAVKPPISPRRALLSSMIMPGLGQARLRRNKAKGLFAAAEVAFIIAARRTADRIRESRRATDSIVTHATLDPVGPGERGRIVVDARVPNHVAGRLQGRRSQYEDWIALIVFNHLMAGADAFVAAQLWDLPAQVSTSDAAMPGAVPSRRVGVGVRVRLP